MKKYFAIFISLIFFIFQGCSLLETRTVAVDSYAASVVPGGTYYLQADNQGFTLQKDQLSGELTMMLAQKGYTRVFDEKDAQYNITYQYQIKGPYQGSEAYPVAPNPWWGMGPYNYPDPFFYDTAWGQGIQYYIYYVQEIFISAADSSGNPVWQIMGSLKTQSNDVRDNFPFLLKGISSYIDKNSGKIIYINVAPNTK